MILASSPSQLTLFMTIGPSPCPKAAPDSAVAAAGLDNTNKKCSKMAPILSSQINSHTSDALFMESRGLELYYTYVLHYSPAVRT